MNLLFRKRRRRINIKHRFPIKDFVNISNREMNSIYSWRCTTTIRRDFVITYTWALLSLIFCSVKSTFALIPLSFNFFHQRLYKRWKLSKKCVNLLNDYVLYTVTWQIPDMSFASSCIAWVKLEHVLFLVLGVYWTLHCMRKPCVACVKHCVSCVACKRLETGLNLNWF